jgi:hypothetical protein
LIARLAPSRRAGQIRRHHREGRVTDAGDVTWFVCGAGDLIQLKMSSTAAANPIANIARG